MHHLAKGLLVVAGRFSAASAFVVKVSPLGISFQSQQQQQLTRTSAIIYGCDGQEEENTNGYTHIGASTLSPGTGNLYDSAALEVTQDPSTAIAQHINQNEYYVGSLARLASVFSPSTKPIELSNLDRVHVLSVDEHHMDIEAIVCDRSECASVLVPVEFPHDCVRDGTMEDCILENLNELDVQAQMSLEHSQSGSQLTLSPLEESLKGKPVDYPSWWVTASSPEMVAECDTIIRLLNNDKEFADDIRNLVCRAMHIEVAQNYLIERAVVSDLGPAGFCFRAVTAHRGSGKSIESHVIDISLPFDGEPRQDAAALRSIVLTAVDGARD